MYMHLRYVVSLMPMLYVQYVRTKVNITNADRFTIEKRKREVVREWLGIATVDSVLIGNEKLKSERLGFAHSCTPAGQLDGAWIDPD